MEDRDQTKIALVTGANKGIGYEIARQLAAAGCTVLGGSRDQARGEAARTLLRADGADVRFVPLDVDSDESVAAVADLIGTDYGRLDILVNNAAIVGPDGYVAPSEATTGSVRAVLETNLVGPIRMLNTMLPLLRAAPAAQVVNLTSGLGSLALNADLSARHSMVAMPYSAAKAGLNRMLLDYAKEFAGTSITINNVSPGSVATDSNNHLGEHTPEYGARLPVALALRGPGGPAGTVMDETGVLPW